MNSTMKSVMLVLLFSLVPATPFMFASANSQTLGAALWGNKMRLFPRSIHIWRLLDVGGDSSTASEREVDSSHS
jgi:hypothetical protein